MGWSHRVRRTVQELYQWPTKPRPRQPWCAGSRRVRATASRRRRNFDRSTCLLCGDVINRQPVEDLSGVLAKSRHHCTDRESMIVELEWRVGHAERTRAVADCRHQTARGRLRIINCFAAQGPTGMSTEAQKTDGRMNAVFVFVIFGGRASVCARPASQNAKGMTMRMRQAFVAIAIIV